MACNALCVPLRQTYNCVSDNACISYIFCVELSQILPPLRLFVLKFPFFTLFVLMILDYYNVNQNFYMNCISD